jgi:hypothetical protein
MNTKQAERPAIPARQNVGHWLFMLSVAWGVAIFWLAPHPPMIDLPQHAAQVTLLRDLISGTSPWSEYFRINPLTPYVLGYGLALPLSFVMPISAALKVLLSLAYVAFVAMCVTLRRHFGGDARLDWLFLISFFGFAYQWGFFTFLLSAPVGLWFIWLADRYGQARSPRLAWAVVAVGMMLLASHGLMFIFAFCVGAALLATRASSLRALLRVAAPFVILGLACLAYLLASLQANEGMETHTTWGTDWGGGLLRLPKAIAYTMVGFPHGTRFNVLAATAVLLLCVPWLLGLRINRQGRSHFIPFATLLLAFILLPSFTLNTAYLYQRFALFLLPTYAWLFSASAAGGGAWSGGNSAAGAAATAAEATSQRRLGAKGLALLIAVSWAILTLHTVRTWRFGHETADIDTITSRLEPGQRALGLIFYLPSEASGDANRLYLHYASWYQAEKQGLVDFNFAWFPPQIVRFRADRLPAVSPGFEWNPGDFDWHKHGGENYRYFIVRQTNERDERAKEGEENWQQMPPSLFVGAPCPPKLITQRGYWMVFERCPAP